VVVVRGFFLKDALVKFMPFGERYSNMVFSENRKLTGYLIKAKDCLSGLLEKKKLKKTRY